MNHLAIDNLTFAYTPKHPTLKDVALKIPLDSWTLFYGASGSGKSTLMRRLIAQIWRQDSKGKKSAA